MSHDPRIDPARTIRAPRGTDRTAQSWHHRSGAPDAHEQPRPGGRGATRRSSSSTAASAGRRATGQCFDRIVAVLQAARRRRVPARPVRQAGRGVQDAPRRAARADRELQPRAALGDLGALQRARPQGPDDVRPDDRRLVDLHRQPGHRAGHLRDVRRGRPPALRRQLGRQVDSDRGSRRHGRGAAARRDDGRRLDARDRVRSDAHRHASADPLPRCAGEHARRGDRPARERRAADLGRAARQRGGARPADPEARAGLAVPAGARHRPDLGARPGERLPARALDARTLARAPREGPGGGCDAPRASRWRST